MRGVNVQHGRELGGAWLHKAHIQNWERRSQVLLGPLPPLCVTLVRSSCLPAHYRLKTGNSLVVEAAVGPKTGLNNKVSDSNPKNMEPINTN